MSYSPILVARVDNVGLHSMFTDQQKFNQLCIEVYIPCSLQKVGLAFWL